MPRQMHPARATSPTAEGRARRRATHARESGAGSGCAAAARASHPLVLAAHTHARERARVRRARGYRGGTPTRRAPRARVPPTAPTPLAARPRCFTTYTYVTLRPSHGQAGPPSSIIWRHDQGRRRAFLKEEAVALGVVLLGGILCALFSVEDNLRTRWGPQGVRLPRRDPVGVGGWLDDGRDGRRTRAAGDLASAKCEGFPGQGPRGGTVA